MAADWSLLRVWHPDPLAKAKPRRFTQAPPPKASSVFLGTLRKVWHPDPLATDMPRRTAGRLGALTRCLLLALVASACGDDPTLVDRELSGTVFDRDSGGTLEDARVVFTSETLITAETQTGGDGRYELEVATTAPFGQVRAEKTGFEPAEATVFFDTPSRVIDLRLRPMRMEE